MQKSEKLVNNLSLRALKILSIAALPTFFIADRPKRIFEFSSIVKSSPDLLMSGGITFIPSLLHSKTACAIFSFFIGPVPDLDSAVIRAVINSTGKFALR